MESFLTEHLGDLGNFPYLVIFFAMLLEGNVTLFTSGFLLSQGVFNPFLLFGAVFLGAMAEDIIWFWFGFKVKGSTEKTAMWAAKITDPFAKHLVEKTFRTMLISNFVYGIHRAVIFRAGMEKMPIKFFVKQAAATLVIWVVLVGSLGYFAGASVGLLGKYYKYAQVLLLVAVIIFLYIERSVVSKKLRRSL